MIAHAAAWVCFLLLPFIFSPWPAESIFNNHNFIVHIICGDIYLIIFYYFNTLFLIPKLLTDTKWYWYVLSCITLFLVFIYVPRQIANWINGTDEIFPHRNNMPNVPPFKRNRFILFSGNTAVFFFVYTIGTCITVVQNWLAAERHKQVIAHEKLNTELSFLKSQINPHFFFNTLNNIYSLAITGNNQTASAIMKLSAIMRYVLSETKNNLVTMNNEVDFIKNYLDLQLVRLTDKVEVNFKYEGLLEDKLIAPLLFMPFIENAFKYGISTKEKTTINIVLIAAESSIHFEVHNKIIKSENTSHETTGIGINNVKRRLELLYPNKHILQVSDDNKQFNVQLDITIK